MKILKTFMTNTLWLVISLILKFQIVVAETYYVTSNADTPCSEEGMPCFTLSYYATIAPYYFASNTTLVFLSGSHSLDIKLRLSDIEILTFETTAPSNTSISCSLSAKFAWKDIGVFSMRGLVLHGCTNNEIYFVEHFVVENCILKGHEIIGSGLKLNWVTNATVLNSSFSSYGGDDIWDEVFHVYVRSGGAILVSNSEIKILNSNFSNCSITKNYGSGGAVLAYWSNMTVNNSTFINNMVAGDYAKGGALFVFESKLILNNTAFTFNSVNGSHVGGEAVYASISNVSVSNSLFTSNSASGYDSTGGAVFASVGNVHIDNCVFINNTVTGFNAGGGAVVVTRSNLSVISAIFIGNTANGDGQPGKYIDSMTVNISTTASPMIDPVYSDSNITGGAILADRSNCVLTSSTFINNTCNAARNDANGGAVYAGESSVFVENNTFYNNSVTGALVGGGAMFSISSNINIITSTFTNNTGVGDLGVIGGAVDIHLSNFSLDSCTFINSSASGGRYANGGAVYVDGDNVTVRNVIFSNNTATGEMFGSGGAMLAESSIVTVNNASCLSNSANGDRGAGGALYFAKSELYTIRQFHIQGNLAPGGTLYATQSKIHFSGNTTISQNYGSIFTFFSQVTFAGQTSITNNSYFPSAFQEGGAITGFQSEIIFDGLTNLSYNIASRGGAITAIRSKVYVYGHITISYNTVSLTGGGIYAYQSELNFENYTSICYNSAVEKGGGIHSISSLITTGIESGSKTYLVGNHAYKGGGACLESNAKFYVIKKFSERCITQCDKENVTNSAWIKLEFTENTADYGGGLYITDDTNSGTCHAKPFSMESTMSAAGECFIQGLTFDKVFDYEVNIRNVYFDNNRARVLGNAIYGGVLDRCAVNPFAEYFYKNEILTPSSLDPVYYITNITNLHIQNITNLISSDAVRVCFCRDKQPNCTYIPQPIHAKKGESFIVSIVAVDQVNKTISNRIINGFITPPAKLGEGQSAQKTYANGKCTDLQYTVLSPFDTEVLSLYAEGPCMDIGISKTNLTIYIEPCPVGFIDIKQHCDCDTILYAEYIFNCSIDNQTVLRKGNVWFSYSNTTDHSQSYVLHKHCPFDYCHPPTDKIHVNLSNANGSDAICAFSRTSKLCGSCKHGLSLALGSSQCMPCTNNWLGLLIIFAIAGVALVAFILVCNLTVAVGTINGLIFYANIIAANHAIFFPFDKPNIITVFLAWLNLDFGFETCFYDGMDTYAKTWLQLAFPLYIISLVVAIIIISDHSFKFASIFTKGKDPIATLATLILLSYAKLIRTIIAALSFTTLEYSDGSQELVWLTDANVPYFRGKHIPLLIVAFAIIVVSVIYTTLLFGWQWIVRCPNIRPFTWITKNTKFISFMDVYHNPYHKNHRYWIGLLLLVRVVLYLVFAVNVLGDPHINLLSINSAVAILILYQVAVLHEHKIHKTKFIHALEIISLSNLIGLTSVTFYVTEHKKSQSVIAYISTAVAFITFIVVLLYHTFVFVLKNPFEKVKSLLKKNCHTNQPPFQVRITTHDFHSEDEKLVSVTEIDALPDPVDTDTEEDQMQSFTVAVEDQDITTLHKEGNNQLCEDSEPSQNQYIHSEKKTSGAYAYFTDTKHVEDIKQCSSTGLNVSREIPSVDSKAIELSIMPSNDSDHDEILEDETTPLL